MQKVHQNKAQMLTDTFQSFVSLMLRCWVWFPEKEPGHSHLDAGVPVPLWGLLEKHYFHFSFFFFFFVKTKILFGFLLVIERDTNAGFSWKWNGVKWTFKKQGVPVTMWDGPGALAVFHGGVPWAPQHVVAPNAQERDCESLTTSQTSGLTTSGLSFWSHSPKPTSSSVFWLSFLFLHLAHCTSTLPKMTN